MRRLLTILTIGFLVSCSAENLADKVEAIGIKRFESIEFGTRDDLEIYTYYFDNDSSYVWSFDTTTDKFDFDSHPDKEIAEKELGDLNIYGQKLRTDIKSIGVVSITQSPWTGNLIRFWTSNTKFYSYVNPNFIFDSDQKNRWLTELRTGEKIKDNWFLVTIKD
jgi:hypothetical protein